MNGIAISPNRKKRNVKTIIKMNIQMYLAKQNKMFI